MGCKCANSNEEAEEEIKVKALNEENINDTEPKSSQLSPNISDSKNLNYTSISNLKNANINSNSYLKTSIGINSFSKNTYNYNPLMTSINMRSAFMNYSQGRKGNNLNDLIIMRKGGAASLKMEIDSLADLKNQKTHYGPENIKQKIIFGRNFMKNYKIGLFKRPTDNSFASFNKSILTDSNWGNSSVGKEKRNENIIFAKHQTKIQVLRELGSNFLNGIKIKLPRDRKIEINK